MKGNLFFGSLCLSVCMVFIVLFFGDNIYCNTYERKWNKAVTQGVYHPRINDEVLFYELKQPKSGIYFDGFCGWNETIPGMTYGVLINTRRQRAYKGWINTAKLRRVNSNWGLTQDIEGIRRDLENKKDKRRKK